MLIIYNGYGKKWLDAATFQFSLELQYKQPANKNAQLLLSVGKEIKRCCNTKRFITCYNVRLSI